MFFRKLITLVIDYINNNTSVYIFKNSNLLSYNIFSFFYKLNICNKSYIDNYLRDSFSKIGIIEKNYLDEINIELKNQRDNTNHNIEGYNMSEKIRLNIKNIINVELKDCLLSFEKYYNARVSLAWAGITRNHPITDNDNKEAYSNYYHSDAYTYNLFKIFINLHDVSLNHGPMHVIKKNKSGEFIKYHKYKSRKNYLSKLDTPKEYVHINTGKKGDIFFCNTTELLHKAGEPNKEHFRDMLFLNFVATPKNLKKSNFFYLEEEGHDVFNRKAECPKIFAKPIGLKRLFNLYNEYKKNKIN